MENVYNRICECIAQIRDTSGTNSKIAILKAFHESLDVKDMKVWQRAVCHTYDPQISFGVKYDAKYDDAVYLVEIDSNDLLNYEDVAYDLSKRKLTGNAASIEVERFFKNAPLEQRLMLRYALLKSFDCGIDEKTIRKIMPGLLPYKVNMMKCEPANEKSLKKVKYPARMELKVDAMRFNAVVTSRDEMYFVTYNGTNFDIENDELKSEIWKVVSRYAEIDGSGIWPRFLDGELVVRDEKGEFLPRKASNGLANRLLKKTAPAEVHERVYMVVWDCIDADEMAANKSRRTNEERADILKDAMYTSHGFRQYMNLVPYAIVTNEEAAQAQVNEYIALGEEGGVLKNFDGFWEGKRSKDCIKFKAEKEADMICTGWLPGDPNGKRYGGIGAYVFESSDGEIVVNVGGGLSDEEIFDDPSKTIGKISTIRFNEVITNKKGGADSLFLPRVIELNRADKDSADTAEVIRGL